MSRMKKPVAHFQVCYSQFIDPSGKTVQELPSFATIDHLIALYSAMVKTRIFDTKAITLQRTGKLGTYASTLGQEAIGVGIGSAMQADDVFCPYYREYGAQFMRGVRMVELLLYWGGDERGSHFIHQPHDFPICVPIASQTLHGTGVACAFKLRKEPRAVVATVGDGGTSRGDFYESINLAGVWGLPIVYVINNNQWAISVPIEKQTAAETLAQKGIAGGVFCEQVDGNDVIAVEYAVRQALDRAREGKPSVIEALSYRMCDHTTADDAKRYREETALARHEKEDPIVRLYDYLVQHNAWDESKDKALRLAIGEEVALAIQEYLDTKPRDPASMMDYLYAQLPEMYQSQRDELEARPRKQENHGD